MSDLQCAATLLLVPVDRAEGLAGRLAGVKVAHVWSATAEAALLAASALAAGLGVGVTPRHELDETEDTDAFLGEIADQHRGETVVVVTEVDEVTEVLIDGDGWVPRRWDRPRG